MVLSAAKDLLQREIKMPLAMMSTSETPTYAPNSNWGTGSDTAEDRPDTSLCEIE